MSRQNSRNRRKLVAASLLALSVVAVLLSAVHFRGNPPGGDGRRVSTLRGHTLPVQALAFSPDGKTLTSAACILSVPLTPMEVAVWDVWSGTRVAQQHTYPDTRRALALTHDGRRLAATVADRDVVLWDVAPWHERARLAVPALFGFTIAFSDDAGQLATTDFRDGVTVWDVDRGCPRSSCKLQPVSSLVFAPGGALLACGATDRNVWLWDPATGEERGVLRGHERPAYTLSFSPNGRLLASGEYSGVVKLWDVATKTLRATLKPSADNFGDEVTALAFSSDSGTLAMAVDRTVQLWDVATGTFIARLAGHEGKVWCLAYSPDGTRLASGSYDRTVRLWDLARYRPMRP
jgi:WD40 repeat protein